MSSVSTPSRARFLATCRFLRSMFDCVDDCPGIGETRYAPTDSAMTTSKSFFIRCSPGIGVTRGLRALCRRFQPRASRQPTTARYQRVAFMPELARYLELAHGSHQDHIRQGPRPPGAD